MKTPRSLPLLLAGTLLLSVPASGWPAQRAPRTGLGHRMRAKGEPSRTLKVTGLDGKVLTYSVADLKDLPHKTVSVYDEHTKAQESYSGVPLTELLQRAGAPSGEALRGKGLLLYIVAEGTDHYAAVYSIDETDPKNHNGDVLVADEMNGAPLTSDGAFKLVSTEDKRPARWVRNLSSITLKSAE